MRYGRSGAEERNSAGYLIATNYILGFDEKLKEELKKTHKHFVEADAAEAAKAGTLAELVNRVFGE